MGSRGESEGMGDELFQFSLQIILNTAMGSREGTDLAGHVHQLRHGSMGSTEVVLGAYEIDAVYYVLKGGCSRGGVEIDDETAARGIWRGGWSVVRWVRQCPYLPVRVTGQRRVLWRFHPSLAWAEGPEKGRRCEVCPSPCVRP